MGARPQACAGSLKYPQRHRRVAFLLPHVPVSLGALRPKNYVEDPKPLGEHLLKRRKEAGKKQVEMAQELEADEATYLHWEKDQTYPGAEHFPRIFRFLGYDPLPPVATPGQQIARESRNTAAGSRQYLRKRC